MRIGIDARFYGGEQSKGLGRYTQKLIEYLLRLDQRNQYVIFLQRETAKRWKLHQANAKIVMASYPWYSVLEQSLLPFKLWQAKLDFIHFPHFNVPLIFNSPFVVTIHDLIISRFPTERATTLGPIMYKIKQVGYHQVISHAARRAKQVITVSQYSKQDIIDFFHLPPEQVSVTYEAVDPFLTSTVRPAAGVLQQYGITTPYVLYVGNAYPHKNLETLLWVVHTLKKTHQLFFKLILVGKEDYFYLRLKQQAWALNVEKEVLFPGFIPDYDLPPLYQCAFAYIFPSQYEGFGLPPLEAMHYRVPVLASNASCLPEVLGQAALYFDFQDVNGIIQQIFQLKNNSGLRAQLVKAGLQQVQRYSWETMVKQTLTIYESVFAKSKT